MFSSGKTSYMHIPDIPGSTLLKHISKIKILNIKKRIGKGEESAEKTRKGHRQGDSDRSLFHASMKRSQREHPFAQLLLPNLRKAFKVKSLALH